MSYSRFFWVGALVVALAGVSIPTASAVGIHAIQGPAAISGPGTVVVRKHRKPHKRRRHHHRHHRKAVTTTLHAAKR